MTYRDDHDAALARADALEEEVRELEREKAKLAGELADAKAHEAAAVAAATSPPPPTAAPVPSADPDPAPTARSIARDDLANEFMMTDAGRETVGGRAAHRASDLKTGVVTVAALVVVLGGAALYGFLTDRAKANARKAEAARTAADQLVTDRLTIAANFSACIADSAWGDEYAQFYAEKHCRDARKESCDEAFAVHPFACDRALDQLPHTPALDHLRQANAAITAARDRAQRDAAVTQRRASYAEVRRDVLPDFRKTIDATLAAANHDDTYWHAKIVLEFRDLLDAALVASKLEQGGAIDFVAAAVAAKPLLERIEAEVKAPSEAHYQVKNWNYFTDKVRAGELDRDTIDLFMHNALETIPIHQVR